MDQLLAALLSRVPAILIGGVAPLPELFKAIALHRGWAREDVRRFVELLPIEIQHAPCFLDRLTNLWRYVFGEPFQFADGSLYLSPEALYRDVERLFDVLACARQRLTPMQQLSTFSGRLRNPEKHQDYLWEFAPILRLGPEVATQYDPEGFGEGERIIDWAIQAPGHRLMLAEVKRRLKDLVEAVQRRTGDGSLPPPAHDHALLFASVERKFRSAPAKRSSSWPGSARQSSKSSMRSERRFGN
jgi:hypothetical protein